METNNNILLVEGIHSKARNVFKKNSFKVQVFQSSVSEKELSSPFIALGIRSRTQLNSHFFKQAESLLTVGAFCIGVNQIDLKSATQKGVAVFNSPYSNTRSVAELTLANIVNLSRKIPHLSHLAHSGKWNKTSQQAYEIRGKTLGIIGYGHIGSQVGILAEAFGIKVYYYDIQKKLSLGNAQSTSSLEELLPLCDFITLHVPQTPQTHNLITQKELSLMKNGSYLLNTSRGTTVIVSDLAKALKKKHLYGAALDVFPEEPASNNEIFKNELQKMDNVILTPHIGGSTEEAQLGIAEDVSERLCHYLIQGNSMGSVNFPQLAPPPIQKNILRIAHVHQNTPGVLSEVNSLVSKKKMNVQSQYLSTNSKIGYLIMDIEVQPHHSQVENIISDIQNLKASIKTRILKGD